LRCDGQPGGDLSPLRRLNIYHLLSQVISYGISGDVVELGCRQGLTTVLIHDVLKYLGSHKTVHVFDSFEGISEPTDFYGHKYQKGSFCSGVEELIANFGLKPLPVIHKGFFEETLPESLPDKICFAHLDSDLYEPIKLSLECVWPKLSPGGIIVIDDYSHVDFPGVQLAVDEFHKGAVSLNMGTGSTEQAFIRKETCGKLYL